MLNQIQPATVSMIFGPIPQDIIARNTRGLVHISQLVRQQHEFWTKDVGERRRIMHKQGIEGVNLGRALVQDSPENSWRIYDFCKKVYDLAELERVDFNAATFPEKVKLIRQLVPFAHPNALMEGVREYHESRVNWTMQFLEEVDSISGQASGATI